MQHVRKINWSGLKHEYGVDGERLLPWGNGENPFPFGGAYCITRGGTVSMPHVNDPADEEEMFICVSGKAKMIIGDETHDIAQGDVIFIPSGVNHYVDNPNTEDFHFYALWWNGEIINGFVNKKKS